MSIFNRLLLLLLLLLLLDEALIPYVHVLVGGDLFEKAQGPVISNQIGVKLGSNQ